MCERFNYLNMRNQLKSLTPIIFTILLFVSYHSSATNDTQKSSDPKLSIYQESGVWHNTSKADQLQQNIRSVLDENTKYHRYSSIYNTLMVEDKIENEYESVHYWALRYFKYDVDTIALFGVQVSD